MAEKPDPEPRKTRRPDTRPTEIMEAAQDLFTTQGFRATSLDQVAEAAGVTKGAIYHYFTGKEDLLLKSMNHRLETHLLPPRGLLDGFEGPASAKVRLLLRHMWDKWMDPKVMAFLRLVEGELVPDYPELMKEWHDESILPAYQTIIDVMEEGKRTGEFRKDLDTAIAVRFLTMGTNKLASMRFHAPFTLDRDFHPDRILDSVLEVYFRGVRAGPGN